MRKAKRKEKAAKARAFYARRQAAKENRVALASVSYGGDVLPPDEAKAMAPWRGCGVVAAVVVVLVVLGWAIEKIMF